MVPLPWRRCAVLALILSTVCPDLVAAQGAPGTPSPQPIEEARRWELTMWLGGAGGGSGGSLESVLRAAGFDDPSPTFKGHGYGSPNPRSHDIGIGHSFDTRIPLRRPLSLVVVFAKTEPGRASGYRATPECCGDFLLLQNALRTFAAVLAVGSGAVHVGLGPALHRTSVRELDGQSGKTKSSRLGALLQVRATVPQGSRVFFAVKGEYRYIPETTVGPFIPNSIADVSDVAPLMGRVRFSHAFVGLGLGVRF